MQAALMRRVLLVSIALALWPATASAAAKVYVVPYAPVYKQLPMELGVRTASLLTNELSAQKKVQLVDVAGPKAGEAASPAEAATAHATALGRAEQLASKGDEALANLEYDAAVESYRAALEAYRQNLAHVNDFGRVVELQLQLAVALFRQHDEDEGERLLADVICIAPDHELDPARYPPLFIRTWEGIRRKLLRLPRGAASVVSDPPGAQVFLDGKPVGKTPILLKEMVRGTHYLRVEAPGVQPWAQPIEVRPTEVARVETTLGGGVEGPAGPLVDALTRNTLDAGVLAKASEFGRKIGADYLVLGALSRGADAYQVKTWLYDVAKGRVAALSAASFDFDLLGAAIEVYKLAGEVAAGVKAFPPAASLPLTLFDGLARSAPVELAEVVVGPPIPREAPVMPGAGAQADAAPVASAQAPERGRTAGPVAPLAPVAPAAEAEPQRREVEGPLAAGPIQVDEDAARTSGGAADGETRAASGPVGPIVPVTKPDAPEAKKPDAEPTRRQVAAVGGPRERLSGSELEGEGSKRYSAVDVEDIVIPKDEVKQDKGWPWWAWGLLAVGVVGAGAGGYYAARETGILGGTPSDATVTIKW